MMDGWYVLKWGEGFFFFGSLFYFILFCFLILFSFLFFSFFWAIQKEAPNRENDERAGDVVGTDR